MTKNNISSMEIQEDKFKEECGVFGIFSKDNHETAHLVYYGLYALQHRGQESAGIAVSNGKEFQCYKDMGLVADIFNEETLNRMSGHAAIGHVRYSTTGDSSAVNAQPLIVRYKLGDISIAHNGNLVNADIIRELLEDGGCIFQTSNDSEVILNLIARGAKKGIERAVLDAIEAVKGSYAILILTEDKLIGVRDPNGIRPLCIGKINDNYVLCSESCALDAIGAELVRDVRPSEMVIIDNEGLKSIDYTERAKHETCAFEYIYFARPDSIIDGINVYLSRVRMGEELYRESPVEADIVIGVPDSGIAAAVGYSKASGIPYGIGFVKNRYVGRTFISPCKELRERSVSVKLNPLRVNVEGKRVILIDDSIVRGTTCRKLADSLKRAGAKEIHFKSASPVVKYPCYFGIDTPYRKELIGAQHDVEEIREEIGVDSLSFLSIEGLLTSLGGEKFCLGCFNGVYPLAAPIENSES